MSDFNVSTAVKFWFPENIKIKEVLSCTKPEYFNLEGKTLASFEPGQRQTLEDFGDRYLIRTVDEHFMEFIEG